MKTRLVLLSIMATVIIFTSCKKDSTQVIPSNNVTSIEKSIAVHSKLDVSDPFRVYLTFSDTEESLVVEANENLHQYVQIVDENGWLKVSLKNNTNLVGDQMVLNIYITTKNINEYIAEGAASISLKNELYSDEMTIELTGASSFSGTLYSNKLEALLSGASTLSVLGSTALLDVDATGGCKMNDYGFESTQLYADLNGASEVSVSVSETLSVKAKGASHVYYKGSGVISHQNLEGGSGIIKMD